MAPRIPMQLTSLPTEILFLIIFCIDDAKDLRSLSSTNQLFRALAGPHTVNAKLWFKKYTRDIPPEDRLRIANKWNFPLETENAKLWITENAPKEPPGLSNEPPGPKRALKRQATVLHIVERFSLFLHNMLAVNYYYTHDWEALQKVADSIESYLEDLGWVQFYRGQNDLGISSMMVTTVYADQEFEAIAFETFTKRLKAEIVTVSSITTSSSSRNSSTYNSKHNSGTGGHSNNNDVSSNRSSELFASLSPEPVYLRWTSLIQDQLNFFCLQQYIMNKFKPPSKLQLAEYLTVVMFGNI
ncbi:763_t:CDS:2 [Funneliformis geosporum]|uniref:9399_t:CDS:1 n=1 Tax=Funneliformis geosporum TaxID=1117311 RepID=A0A9W4T9V5_9GLOM|nr:763_t:CDS:2 [Funneliformis geosporum]CAI2195750.1 9399_t:CDS:2 [Funneliformis geosporum]